MLTADLIEPQPQYAIDLPQQKWRWWSGLIFFICVIVLLFWGGWRTIHWMSDAHRLPISQMVIEGQLKYTNVDEIRSAIGQLGRLDSFMLQNVDEIQQQLEQLPWVKQVAVRKQWPNQLKLYMVEQQAKARWNDNALLNSEGTIFAPKNANALPLNLIRLYGPDQRSDEVLAMWHYIDQTLGPKFNVAQLSLSPRRAWHIVLADGVVIELGQERVKERIRRFVGLYPILQKEGREIAYIDLRYDTGAAVKWRDSPDGRSK
ncbi:Cell division protein FtsQ [Vibrio stylophorae]|uniref:Cell division protein FtsQ n=1 Tax=Vibrio stylophorae TaxID=659351 RepID=A0ABN8DYK2_9VIBR|nr:cell division protein FtsQ/DivIB [Vibrio stylophorae]CAH0534447.1 Cell division protein FtsQ [Vibrio stylophorae]